jgi:hypothetical protein
MRTKAEAELVFNQFAHGANAAIPQVVDVVHGIIAAGVLLQGQQVADGRVKVFRLQGALIERQLHRA